MMIPCSFSRLFARCPPSHRDHAAQLLSRFGMALADDGDEPTTNYASELDESMRAMEASLSRPRLSAHQRRLADAAELTDEQRQQYADVLARIAARRAP